MQRLLAAIWIRGGKTIIRNPGFSDDDRAVMQLMEQAGCSFHFEKEQLHVDAVPVSKHKLDAANLGESGLASRMCIPLLALAGRDMEIAGKGSLLKRPMYFFEEVLPQLGVQCKLVDGHLPAMISGKLDAKNIEVDGSLSSQYITGLLFAYAALNAHEVHIQVKNPVSKPYLDLSLDVLERVGLKLPQLFNSEDFYFNGKSFPQKPLPGTFDVEGDWSNAAFWLVAGAIAGPITIDGLDLFSTQADKAVLGALMESEAVLSIQTERIRVGPAARLKAFQFDATDCPDLFPPLAVLGCYAEGTSVISGISRLKHKESDRAKSICDELGRIGASMEIQDDHLVIRGGGELHGTMVNAHGDHRIAMMCAIAALKANGPVRIEGAESVAKSYPHFFKDLEKMGAVVEYSE
jgi:3-phosphoshikimate 1-carboxyvinyltransferase